MATPLTSRSTVRAALERAGWQIDIVRPDRIEASDGERYGVAVFFEDGEPTTLKYGDGELDSQYAENWREAPGIFAPDEVRRLLHEVRGE